MNGAPPFPSIKIEAGRRHFKRAASTERGTILSANRFSRRTHQWSLQRRVSMRHMKYASAAALLLLSTSLASALPARVETPLNVRSGEGTQFPVIATMPAGAVVDASNCGDGWCYIAEYGGFASASYLSMSGAGYGPGPVGVYEPAPSVVVPLAGDPDYYSYGYYEPYRYGYGYRYSPGIAIRGEIGDFRRDFRDDWRESRRDWRQERRDAWQDRREVRQDIRQDLREAQRDARQERREERRDARQERWERRDDRR